MCTSSREIGRLFSGVNVPFFGIGKIYPRSKHSGITPHWRIRFRMLQRSSKKISGINLSRATEIPEGPGQVSAAAVLLESLRSLG